MRVPEIDKQLGIEVYVTETPGVGGVIRRSADDFVVEEVLVDGSIAAIEGSAGKPPLGATAGKQRFLLCVLVKRNWDTLMAVKNVARQLGIDQNRISIAGIKDAKAVTAQHLSLEGVSAEDVAGVRVRDVELRPLGYFHEALGGYYLLGNNFNIKVKAINHPRETIEKRIARVAGEIAAAGGIPNFYGHQRFGTKRPITHLVGKAIVQGNLEEAAMLFLAKPSPLEHPESRQARVDLHARRDFKQALRDFPRQLRYERLMLAHLAEAPKDFAGAFRRLPLKLRLLFVQACQSFLFNCFLSERLKRGFSLNRVEAGDYVVNVERSGLPMIRTARIVEETMLGEVAELMREGRLRVALPIVGFKQRLSQGEMGEMQHRVLESEGVAAEDFEIPEMPEVNARGEVRAIVSPVRDFEVGAMSPDLEEQGKSQVEAEFMLLRGSYATVLLRELMKPFDPLGAGF